MSAKPRELVSKLKKPDPAKNRDLKGLIREKYGGDASWLVERIHELAFDDALAPKKIKLEACRELLDRGWGKPAQTMQVTATVPIFALPEGDDQALLPDLGNAIDVLPERSTETEDDDEQT